MQGNMNGKPTVRHCPEQNESIPLPTTLVLQDIV